MCAHMDLNPTDALLGYKFSGDPVWTPPYHLSNDGELCEAINKGVQKMQRARTWVMFIEVHNLVCHIGTQIPAFAKYVYISDLHTQLRMPGITMLHWAQIALSHQTPLLHSLVSFMSSSAILNANNIMDNIVMSVQSMEPTNCTMFMCLHSQQRKS